MRTKAVAGALAAAACIVLCSTASAQSTKGTGKVIISLIKWPVPNIQAKQAGFFLSKPAASVPGKPPTGGTIATLKLGKEVGNPLKPGFAPGEYVLELETGVTPDSDVGVSAFVAFSIDSLSKCTVKANPTVDGQPNVAADPCGDAGEPLCAPIPAGKCLFTTYQAAGIPNYLLGPGDGQPTATRIRIRNNPDPANCETGHINLGGTPVPATSTCKTGSVVAVGGVANGDVDP